MYCMKCGAKIPDGGRFCATCGTDVLQNEEAKAVTETVVAAQSVPTAETVMPIAGSAQAAVTAPVAERKKMSPKKKRLALIFSAVAAVVVVVVVLLVVSLNNIHSSPEKLAEAVVKAYCEVDVETVVEALPDFAVRDRLGNSSLSAKASRKQLISRLKMTVNVYEERQSVKVLQCIVTDRIDMDDIDPDDYGMTNMDYFSITDTAVVEVWCIIDGEMETREVYCIEMDGKWYVLDLD